MIERHPDLPGHEHELDEVTKLQICSLKRYQRHHQDRNASTLPWSVLGQSESRQTGDFQRACATLSNAGIRCAREILARHNNDRTPDTAVAGTVTFTITAVEILNPIQQQDRADAKLAILDVSAQDADDHRHNIEMQTTLPVDLQNRLTYYNWAN